MPTGAPDLVTTTVPQLSVYKALISAAVGPAGAVAIQLLMFVAPNGNTPVNAGAVLSIIVITCVNTTLRLLQSSLTVHVLVNVPD